MHTNQRILVDALIKRGATVTMLDPADELLEVNYNGSTSFLQDRFSTKSSYPAIRMTADKMFTKNRLLSKGFNAPEGRAFSSFSLEAALEFAKNLYPVVLKPNWGSHGDCVVVNITSEQELRQAIVDYAAHQGLGSSFIVEKAYLWPEYRFFVTSKNEIAVLHREWAYVIGDGVSSIESLIFSENYRRNALKKASNTSLCPIVIDEESKKFLKSNGLSHCSVPNAGDKIYLRQESNLAKGGVSIDVTDEVCATLKNLAFEVLKAFPGLTVAGLDILCPNIKDSSPQYQIIEINSNPGLTMHVYPAFGRAQPVGEYLANALFD